LPRRLGSAAGAMREPCPAQTKASLGALRFCSILALILLGASAFSGAASPLNLPFHEDFGAGGIQAAWKVAVSGTNQVHVSGNALEDRSRHEHLRPYSAALGVGSGSGCLHAQAPGRCQLGLFAFPVLGCAQLVPGFGARIRISYYAVELVDGAFTSTPPIGTESDWYHLAVALGGDGLRFQSSADGKSWDSWLILARPENWKKPAALLMLGKGFSQDEGTKQFTATALNNDFSERGARCVSLISDVSVDTCLPARCY